MLLRQLKGIGLIIPLLALGACGGGGTTTPPPPVDNALASIVVTPTTLALAAGQQQTITAQGRTAAGAAVSGVTFAFSSSNSNLASVSTSGVVTGLAAGSATITVTGSAAGVSRSATAVATVTGTLPNEVTVVSGAASNDFTPRDVAIARGGKVTWTFGARVHNVDFQGQAGAPAGIPNTSNSAGIERTFATAGNYAYLCTLHSGMSGSVFVP